MAIRAASRGTGRVRSPGRSIALSGAGGGGGGGGTADTWDPTRVGASVTLSNSNKTLTTNGDFSQNNMGVAIKNAANLKVYMEYVITTKGGNSRLGFFNGITTVGGADEPGYFLINPNTGDTFTASGINTGGSAFADGDILGIAFDFTGGASNGVIQFYKNNVANGDISGFVYPATICLGQCDLSFTNQVVIMKTLDADFTYPAPTGYTAWGAA